MYLSGCERSVNAVGTYERRYEAFEDIRGYLAFYPEWVDVIEAASRRGCVTVGQLSNPARIGFRECN
ncbi:hypothetical protein E0H68_03360 [Rhizobium leguminosarum bv. viciae]|nr:hypothetical protein E0H68_03360 [Rhizobium leguminosarum bv. viciae]